MTICTNCDKRFESVLQLGAHVRSCCNPNAEAVNVDVEDQEEEEVNLSEDVVVIHPDLSLHDLVKRKCGKWGRIAYVQITQRLSPHARDYRPLQRFWKAYTETAHKCCSAQFWKLFSSVRNTSTVCKDSVFNVVKNMLPAGTTGHKWSRSYRVLMSRVDKRTGNFWDHVTNTYNIDLTR